MEKNIANQKFRVFAFNVSTGVPLEGDAAQITGQISIDGGVLAAITDTNPTEIENGYYEFDATQSETNGKEILVVPESSTVDIQVVGVPALIKTDTPNMSDLGIESDGDLTKVNTLDGNTPQTGDAYAESVAIKAVTDLIPDAGAMTSISQEATAAKDATVSKEATAAKDATVAKEATKFDPATETVARVTLVDTTTANTDMRGTNSALIDKDGFTLSATGIDDILDELIGDGTITMREALRGLIAHITSKASGGGTTELTFRNYEDTKDVIVKTVDANGNRSNTIFTP